MLEVVVKTLDSQNHSFSVPDESTVKEFKAQIAPVLNIAAEKQRLIFCGKVLKDDKKLNEYDVNGKVIHVVQSLPPQGNSSSTPSSSGSTTSSASSRNVPRDAAGFLLGAFAIPQDLVDPSQVQNIVQDVAGLGDIGRNATVVSRTSDDGSVDVHINLGRVPVQVPLHSEAQLRMNRIQTMLIRANHLLESLEDGSNSNNGAVADSSSQTEAENAAARSSDSDSQNETLPSSSPDATTITAEVNINPDIPSEINLGNLSGEPEGFRFEGLAHAAQAAISAAFAAAARAATSSLSSPEASPPGQNDQASEPMDVTPSPVPDLLNTGSSQPAEPSVIPMDALPTDTAGPSTSEQASSKKDSTAADDSENHHPDCPFSAARTPPTTTGPSSSQSTSSRPRATQASVQTLANLLDEVIRVNTRLQPCLEKCRDLIRSDSVLTGRALGDATRLFSRISQLMHFLGHAYHSLSDLHVNFNQDPPRSPSVRIISSSHNPPLFQGIPMQAQISISTSSVVVPNTSISTTTTASNASNDSSNNSNSEARPVPAPRASQATSSTPNSLSYMAGSQSPVVFMEVSPGSLTIDSISSIAAPFGSLSGAASDSSPRSHGTPSSTPGGRDNQPSAAEPPTGASRGTSRSSSANGSAAQQMNIPFQNLIPVPLTSMGSLHTFDAGLPCHSVWALEPSRRRHNAGGSRSSSTSGVTPNAPGRQEDQLQQIIGNIMMSLLNHVPTEINRSVPRNPNAERAGAASNQPQQSIEVLKQKLQDLDLLYKTVSEGLPNLQFNSQTLCGKIMNFLSSTLTFNSLIDIMQGKFGALDKYEAKINNFIQANIKDWNPDVDDKKDEMLQVVQEFENIIRSCSFLRERRGKKEEFYRAINVFARDYVFKIYKAAGISKLDQSPKFGENLMRHLHFAFLEFLDILKKNTIGGFKDLKTKIMLELAHQTSTMPVGHSNALYEFFSQILLRVEESYEVLPRNYSSPRGRSNPNYRASTASTSSSGSTIFPAFAVSDLSGHQQLMNEMLLPWLNWGGSGDMLGETPPTNLTRLSGSIGMNALQTERLKQHVVQQYADLHIIDKKLADVVGSLFDSSTQSGTFMKFLFETLTFRDVIDILFKNYSCLNKHSRPLYDFVCEHYFDAPTEVMDLDKLKRCFAEVTKIILSFSSDFQEFRELFKKDLERFFTKCAEIYVPDIIRALLDKSDQSRFGQKVFSLLMKIFKDFGSVIYENVGVEQFITKGVSVINEESFGLTGRKKEAVQSLFKNVYMDVIFRTPMGHNIIGNSSNRNNTPSSSSNSGVPGINRRNAAEVSTNVSQESHDMSSLPLLNLDEEGNYTYEGVFLQWRPVIRKTLGEVFLTSSSEPKTLCGRIMKLVFDTLKIQDILEMRFATSTNTIRKYYKKIQQFIQDNLSDSSSIEQLKNEIKTWLGSFSDFIKIPDESKFASELDKAIESSVSQISQIKNASEVYFEKTVLSALKFFLIKLYDVYHRYTENGVPVIRRYVMQKIVTEIGNLKESFIVDVDCQEFTNFFFDDVISQLITSYHEKSDSTSKQNSDSKDKRTSSSLNGSEASRPTSTSQGVRRLISETPRGSRGTPTFANFAQFAEQNPLLRNSRQSSIPPVPSLARVVIGSEGWHNSVPRDWVPIITRDVHCQRRQASQAPFSNAYLSGMPSKRRKIMSNGNTALLEQSQSALSDMLMQAILSADVKPKTNIEEVKKEAAQDAPLQVSFNEHMKQAIRERLNCDGDYCSERFPNSEKYFN